MGSVLWRIGVTTISVELRTTNISGHGAIREHPPMNLEANRAGALA
jgi:hypothetical protein